MNHARHRLMAGLAVWFVGCGAPADSNDSFAPADWVGVWEGTLTGSGLCSDRSSLPRTNAGFSVNLEVNGSILTWMVGCGATGTATIRGNTADLGQWTCPTILKNGNAITGSITGGTMVLSRNALQFTSQSRIVIEGRLNATCTESATGRLRRPAP